MAVQVKRPYFGADRGVHVVADAVAVVQNGLGLQSVGRNPAQNVQAGAEGVALGGTPVELAEAQILRSRCGRASGTADR